MGKQVVINATHVQRADTENIWTTTNPILQKGEMAFEIDTYRFKVGDGISPYKSLKYYSVKGYEETFNGNQLTEFTISHNQNIQSPLVLVYNNNTNKRLSPEIFVLDSNNIKISFIYPVSDILRVAIF